MPDNGMRQLSRERGSRWLDLLRVAAVVVAVVLIGACRTPQPKHPEAGAAAVGKLTETRTLQVDGLALDATSGKGTVAKLRVVVGPSGGRGLDVSVAGAAPGSALQATLWIAAHMAAGIVGRPLEEYSIKVACTGPVGGAGLGATLTSALVAAMRGVPVDKQAALSGSLLMSRSIGPVAGLPQLLAAAAAAGKKVFGYPVGQRHAMDLDSGEQVDLQALAAKHGIKLVELRNAFDAYRVLTGKELAQPQAIGVEAMELTQGEWRQMLATSREMIDQAAKLYDKSLKDGQAVAQDARVVEHRELTAKAIEKARSWWTQRRAVEAFESAHEARTAAQWDRAYAAIVSEPASADEEPFSRGAAALEQIREKIAGEFSFRRFRFEQSLNHAVWDIAVYQRLLVALLRSAWSRQQLEEAKALERALASGELPKEERERKTALQEGLRLAAALHGSVAWAELMTAQDLGKLQVSDAAGTVGYDETALRDLSLTFLNTAQVALQYYRDVVGPTRGSKPPSEPELVLEQEAAGVQAIPDQVIAKKWGAESAPTAIVRLAGAKEALIAAAMLLDHALQAGKGHEEARKARLGNARRTALQWAFLAKGAVGEVPMSARLAFQLAKAREAAGDLAGAIKGYWRSGMESDEAVVLARTAKAKQK